MDGNLFVADTILAKHDERYMPPQMANTARPR
jgi:cytochrome c-type biogenesis protein CcmE